LEITLPNTYHIKSSQSSFDQLGFDGFTTGVGFVTLIDGFNFLAGFWGNELSDGKAGPLLAPFRKATT